MTSSDFTKILLGFLFGILFVILTADVDENKEETSKKEETPASAAPVILDDNGSKPAEIEIKEESKHETSWQLPAKSPEQAHKELFPPQDTLWKAPDGSVWVGSRPPIQKHFNWQKVEN